MGNDLTLLYKTRSGQSEDLYARRYMEDASKSFFIDRIKEKNKKKLEQDINYKPKKITEPLLIQEAFSQYLQMDRKEKLALLLNHPALTRQDFSELLELSVKSTETAFYAALGGSLFTYLIYKKWIQRYHVFYNYFRKKHKYRATGILKKGFAGFVLFYTWLAGANYYYKEKMRQQIEAKGYMKKYFVDPEAVYVEDDG